jgi:hypothetical protein
LNSLSTNSTLSINNLNNKTNFSNLLVSNASTFRSSLNVSGPTTLNNITTINSTLNVKGGITNEGINIVDGSSYIGQFQLGISPPTATTNSKIQTIKQGTGFNQVLDLQPVGGTIILSGNTTAKSNLNVVGNTTCNIIYSNGIASNGISVVDSSSTTNQYQMFMTAPTASTPSTIQTIQQNVGYNQNLILQGIAGSGNIGISSNNPQAKLHVGGTTIINNATTLGSSLNVVGNVTTSGLSVFNINSNLNSLSSYSFLNISGISNNLNN